MLLFNVVKPETFIDKTMIILFYIVNPDTFNDEINVVYLIL